MLFPKPISMAYERIRTKLILCRCASKKQLLVWSFDGLSAWFLDSDAWGQHFPNVKRRFDVEGCRVEVQPVFPTKTFPCHTSIVTGAHNTFIRVLYIIFGLLVQ